MDATKELIELFRCTPNKNIKKWLGFGNKDSDGILKIVSRNNFSYLKDLVKYSGICNCYFIRSGLTGMIYLAQYYKCGCKCNNLRYRIFYKIISNKAKEIVKYANNNSKYLHPEVLSNIVIFFANNNSMHKYFDGCNEKLPNNLLISAKRTDFFLDKVADYLSERTKDKINIDSDAISMIKDINSFTIFNKKIGFGGNILVHIIENVKVDLEILLNAHIYIDEMYILKMILSRYDITLDEFFSHCNKNVEIDDEVIESLYKEGAIQKMTDIVKITRIIMKLEYNYSKNIFDIIVFPALDKLDDASNIPTKVFNIFCNNSNYQTDENYNFIRHMLDNYYIMVTNRTLIKFFRNWEIFTDNFHSNSYYHLKDDEKYKDEEDLELDVYEIVKQIIHNTIDIDVDYILNNIKRCHPVLIEILVMVGNYTITYDTLKKVSPGYVINDITRYGLEYGEDLFKTFYGYNGICIDYYHKSTFIPQKYCDLWLLFSQKCHICVDSDEYIVALVQLEEYFKNNLIHGYFLQMFYESCKYCDCNMYDRIETDFIQQFSVDYDLLRRLYKVTILESFI